MDGAEQFSLGIDIGGTFTDIVALGSQGSVLSTKVSSTPDDYGRGISNGIRALLLESDITPTAIAKVVHATTVATNTILENKGAKTGLITTEGFRDILELRRIRIPEMYNLDYQKPVPLVPRKLRLEVKERLGPKGEIRIPLDEGSVRTVAARLKIESVEAIAIVLIHGYANPEHERRVAAIVRECVPTNIYICCSHKILPEIREYERTSTTVVNALLGPVMSTYLSSLGERLTALNIDCPLQIMQSNGGLMSVRSAIEAPARLLESGPAAGVIAAAQIAQQSGVENVITLDMGGTTAKTALIEGGLPAKTTEYEVGAGINLSSRLLQGAGYAVKLPFIDVSEIGAGGGSLIWFNKGGMIQVGPQSAGADPGPVCYGAGGTQATLTDALVCLGYLNPDYLVGGELTLHAKLAANAIQDQVCEKLDRELLEACYGIFTIATSNMMRAVKAVSTYRGRDPRDFSLLAFGGNGPLMALEIARELQISRLLVPPSPGVFSALGLLVSEAEYESIRTLFGLVTGYQPSTIDKAFKELESEVLAELASDGLNAANMQLSRLADFRYAGQAFELTIPLTSDVVNASVVENTVDAFHREHERTYQHMSPEAPVELVNIRVVSRSIAADHANVDPRKFLLANTIPTKPVADRLAYYGPRYDSVLTPVISRGELDLQPRHGPLIIEEYDATCVVPPGSTVLLDDGGNIEIHIGDYQ